MEVQSNFFDFIVVGGGAAGFFAAVTAKKLSPNSEVIILERSAKLLSKVRISGGGRCNVTHACFDPKELICNYPRGAKELLGPFHTFQPKDTVKWFSDRGVTLKTEQDGRIFPESDNSLTIIDTLLKEADDLKVKICTKERIDNVSFKDNLFILESKEKIFRGNCLLLATGSHPSGHEIARNFNHTIQDTVPSLFTFNVPDFT